jgi:hypothetical protein
VEVEYQVRASGVVNLNGLGDGGGEATLFREQLPLPDADPDADSLSRDSLAAPASPLDSADGPDGPPGPDAIGAALPGD